MEQPQLLPFQQEAVQNLLKLIDEHINPYYVANVGSGKTRVACQIIKALHQQNPQMYILILCSIKNNMIDDWKKTLNMMGIDAIVCTDGIFNKFKLEMSGYDNDIRSGTVLIMSYKLFSYFDCHLQIQNVQYLIKHHPGFIIFDEFHHVSNSYDNTDKRIRNAIQCLPDCIRLGLSATPIANDQQELDIAFSVLNGNRIKTLDADKIKEIKSKFVYQYYQDYTKTQLYETQLYLPMSVEEYEEVNNDQLDSRNRIRFHFSRFEEQHFRYHRGKIGVKLLALSAIISLLKEDEKIIVLDNYIRPLQIVSKEPWIQPYHPVLYYTRGLSKKEREVNYHTFLSDPRCRVFLATTKSAGESLNLQIANHIVLLNRWWAPKDMEQCKGRIKRLSQTKNIFTYEFILCQYISDDTYTLAIEDNWIENKLKKKTDEITDNGFFLSKPSQKIFQSYETCYEDIRTWLKTLYHENEGKTQQVESLLDNLSKLIAQNKSPMISLEFEKEVLTSIPKIFSQPRMNLIKYVMELLDDSSELSSCIQKTRQFPVNQFTSEFFRNLKLIYDNIEQLTLTLQQITCILYTYIEEEQCRQWLKTLYNLSDSPSLFTVKQTSLVLLLLMDMSACIPFQKYARSLCSLVEYFSDAYNIILNSPLFNQINQVIQYITASLMSYTNSDIKRIYLFELLNYYLIRLPEIPEKQQKILTEMYFKETKERNTNGIDYKYRIHRRR